MVPKPGMRYRYQFLSDGYAMSVSDLTVYSVDSTSASLETSHGVMTFTYWNWLIERELVQPLPSAMPALGTTA